MVFRVYVEKKPGFDLEAQALCAELRNIVQIEELESLRLINRYDVEGISAELFETCVSSVFSEAPTDVATKSLRYPADAHVFAVEYLPGQFDQRADSAAECIQLISQGERPEVRSAKVYILEGDLTDARIETIQHYVINPVEARLASPDVPETLRIDFPHPAMVETVEGFLEFSPEELTDFIRVRGLAMDLADIEFCRQYFRSEGRCPTIAEIKMIDTYWSDHCRHTTFGTVIDEIEIHDAQVQAAYERYLETRHELGRDEKPICLMDMATLAARALSERGILQGLDESEEINACTVKTKVDVDGELQDWLYLFKNETHNHPTEIEPFGGAATCVGGAIRDPLSGRSYVYQAMRVTGAADPRVPVSRTLAGKLPQRKLVCGAAAGYSSYGNQIGLATGQVSELYHPGYAAKRLEIGAVVGATPADHVRREKPDAGDVIILLGGRTGRDGIGGATGSSKAHNVQSIETCGAEVQKGNAPIERKIQRLFRRADACRLIKRCNDFGAGGVSVAVGELADGLDINLDRVPKKYEGLDGCELAIAESQERMAVAVAAEDVQTFITYATEENLEATPIATVTDEARVRMHWQGATIIDISREFLASNGAPKHTCVEVDAGGTYMPSWEGNTLEERLCAVMGDINVASNKGLSERFDSTIGAATVLMPFGGKTQLTPASAMAAKLPVVGETTTMSGMAWGFNPYLSATNQFQGAYLAVVESVSRLVAAGFEHGRAYLTLQEYFEKLRGEPRRWGKPVASVLGAFAAQMDLGVGAIGGKDSMSGSFENLDVPPTLVSFATAIGDVSRATSPEFKGADHEVVLIQPACELGSILPSTKGLLQAFNLVEELIRAGHALAVATPGYGCLAEALFKMCVGNQVGFDCVVGFDQDELFRPAYGSFVVELAPEVQLDPCIASMSVIPLGRTQTDYCFTYHGEVSSNGVRVGAQCIDVSSVQQVWESALEEIFPYRAEGMPQEVCSYHVERPCVYVGPSFARPRVIIPVFPGTNCEYDTARAFERAGAVAETLVINNLSPSAVAESATRLAEAIKRSQIIMIPGGFSGADEPDGSAKFITSFFRAPQVTEAVRELLQGRQGLMLGICNGFQALVKLGLVPFGDICAIDENCPTLTFNTIGRHQSRLVRTRVVSDLSPWLSACPKDEIYTIAISHGEGRFVANPDVLQTMKDKGQIATQYVDESGVPSMDLSVNPNGSVLAIEGITSADGRIFGKMGHSERSGQGLYANVAGNKYQPIFEGGVAYFA